MEEASAIKSNRLEFGSEYCESIPLIGVSAEVDVIDVCTFVRVHQLFENIEEFPIEAT